MLFFFSLMSIPVSQELSSAHAAWMVAWQLYSQLKKNIQLMGGLCWLFHTCSAFSPSTLFVIHLYRGRQVLLKHHILFRGSSPSEPNEHVEIQWILICCYIGTRDKSAREDLLGGNWKERAALLDFPCILSETGKKGTTGQETINFGNGNLLFLPDERCLKRGLSLSAFLCSCTLKLLPVYQASLHKMV